VRLMCTASGMVELPTRNIHPMSVPQTLTLRATSPWHAMRLTLALAKDRCSQHHVVHMILTESKCLFC
jgi:hypothetical protein